MGSRDIVILVYVGILLREYSVYIYSFKRKVSIAKVSVRSALKWGVAVEGVFLDYSLSHAIWPGVPNGTFCTIVML